MQNSFDKNSQKLFAQNSKNEQNSKHSEKALFAQNGARDTSKAVSTTPDFSKKQRTNYKSLLKKVNYKHKKLFFFSALWYKSYSQYWLIGKQKNSEFLLMEYLVLSSPHAKKVKICRMLKTTFLQPYTIQLFDLDLSRQPLT